MGRIIFCLIFLLLASPLWAGSDSDSFTVGTDTLLENHTTTNGVSWIQPAVTGNSDLQILESIDRVISPSVGLSMYYYDDLTSWTPITGTNTVWTVWFHTPNTLALQQADELLIAFGVHDVTSVSPRNGYWLAFGIKGYSGDGDDTVIESWAQEGSGSCVIHSCGLSGPNTLTANTDYKFVITLTYWAGFGTTVHVDLYNASEQLIDDFDYGSYLDYQGKMAIWMVRAGTESQFQLDSVSISWPDSLINTRDKRASVINMLMPFGRVLPTPE